MNKNILALIIGVFIISSALYITGIERENQEIIGDEINEEENKEMGKEEISQDFFECLKEKGVVIYGNRTCPACARLAEEFGGYDAMSLIYVECTEEMERCNQEMLVNYVPAVQINDELFEEWGSPENLAKETGCEL